MSPKLKAQTSLLLVAIVWGITFVLVKNALNDAPPFSFATLRFGLATFLTLGLLNKKILSVSKQELIGGGLCGLFLFMGYAFQNFGLMHTTPSKSAFITSISVLIVPLVLVALGIQKVKLRIWIAVGIATIGLYLLILPGGKGLNVGDALTFGCSMSFAVHIIAQDSYLKKKVNLLPFFLSQSITVTIISGMHGLVFEPELIIWSQRLIHAILITGVLATFLAFLVMIWAQKILNPSETAIIFAMEPVAAAIYAVSLGVETLGFWAWLGGSLICLAVVYGERGGNS
tara:strand:- start:192 stop:1049 length:858 start_codon:yes stop_codon:yes gene_type:complete